MSQEQAKKEAINIAKQKLKSINLNERLNSLKLSNVKNGIIHFKMFHKNYIFNTADFNIINIDTKEDAKLGDQILLLHYLLCDQPYIPSEKQISFRDFTGGIFYWNPFLSKTTIPLVKKIGDNLQLLKNNLERFDWEEINLTGFTAKIHAIGNINLYIIYHTSDEEFPAQAEILFDEFTKKIYNAEDASYLASHICLGLL